MNWENVPTDRLLLKGIDESDIEFIFKHFSNDFVCQFLYDEEPFAAVAEAKELIKAFQSEKNWQMNRWVIIEQGSKQKIGTCGFMFWDKANNSIEIGYDLEKEYCNQGFMTEALSAAIDKAFFEKGINRIQAITYIDNLASCRLLEKLGFLREGTIRDKHLFRGQYYDHYCYSVLKREWRRRT